MQTRIIFICFSGFNGLMEDTKLYYQISKEVWKGKELHTFSRKELVIHRQVNKNKYSQTCPCSHLY